MILFRCRRETNSRNEMIFHILQAKISKMRPLEALSPNNRVPLRILEINYTRVGIFNPCPRLTCRVIYNIKKLKFSETLKETFKTSY